MRELETAKKTPEIVSMIDHLSYSSISTYLACPESWRRKYIAKEPTITTPALVFGSAIHGTIEEYISAGGKLPELWSKHWNNAIEGQTIAWDGDTPETHYNEGVRILGNEQVIYGINTLKPRSIEQKVELNVSGVPVPIIGYIDVITEDGTPGDIKTSSKSWNSERAAGEMQPLFYLAALNQAGEKIDWRFRHFVITKTKAPKFETFETKHNPSEVLFLFNLIRGVWRGIEREVFPVNPTSWKCTPRYCDFWAECRGKY